MSTTRILSLTLKRKYFDAILRGEKQIEYRKIKPYWVTRLWNKHYDLIRFTNGYSKDSEWFEIMCNGITIMNIKDWESNEGNPVAVIARALGTIVNRGNIKAKAL